MLQFRRCDLLRIRCSCSVSKLRVIVGCVGPLDHAWHYEAAQSQNIQISVARFSTARDVCDKEKTAHRGRRTYGAVALSHILFLQRSFTVFFLSLAGVARE